MSRAAAATALLLAVALALGSVASAAGAGAATRREPLHAAFPDLRPGATASEAWALGLPRRAVLAGATVTGSGSPGLAWDVGICRPATGACVPVVDGATGTVLPPGAYELRVAVTAAPDLAPGAAARLDGHLVLADARPVGRLAATGVQAPPLLALAAAAVAVGLLLIGRARRGRRSGRG